MEIIHERYKRIHEGVKYYFYIDSDNLKKDFEFISEKNITNIKLTPDLYKLGSINALLQLKHIQSLEIFIKGVDLSKLCQLDNLEELGIGELNLNIDVSNLKKLQDFYLLYHKNIKGLNTLSALKKMIVVKAEAAFFSEANFGSWKNLDELASLSSKLPPNLLFLKNNQKLRELEIHNTRTQFDVSDLSLIKESLEILKIGSCKKVEGIEEVLPKLTNLRWFALTDAVPLKNSRFVDILPNLDTLVVLGSSYFENGDLSNLKGKMKHIGIDDKKHYSLKTKDFSL